MGGRCVVGEHGGRGRRTTTARHRAEQLNRRLGRFKRVGQGRREIRSCRLDCVASERCERACVLVDGRVSVKRTSRPPL